MLGTERENNLRNFIKLLNGKIAIVKDISSFKVPDDEYDVNILFVKVTFDGFKQLLKFFKHNDIAFINICDDYNPSIFSHEDTYMSFNENYNFKFFVSNRTKYATLLIRYGNIKDTESFMQECLKNIINQKNTPNKITDV